MEAATRTRARDQTTGLWRFRSTVGQPEVALGLTLNPSGLAVRMWAVSNYLNEGQRADMPTIQDILGTGTRR